MKRRHVSMLCIVAALVFLGNGFGSGQEIAAQPGRMPTKGWKCSRAGPVHEAFAGTVSFNPEPGIVTLKAPPEAIEELPPEQRPEGANVAWIPGYWAWDDERNDFLWVSGIWRDLPPGRQWVPGYWGQAAQGSQWTSGYWADAQASEIEYLPEPPQSVECQRAAPAAGGHRDSELGSGQGSAGHELQERSRDREAASRRAALRRWRVLHRTVGCGGRPARLGGRSLHEGRDQLRRRRHQQAHRNLHAREFGDRHLRSHHQERARAHQQDLRRPTRFLAHVGDGGAEEVRWATRSTAQRCHFSDATTSTRI